MQQNELTIKPDEIIDILIRYRWLLVIPLSLALTVGFCLSLLIPRVYSSSTTILIQAQKVPGTYVKSLVTSGIEERISTISQQIMSRSNLEKIIKQFGLFQENKDEKMYLEDKIKSLRDRITVDITRDRKGADAFTILYRGTNPERVMKITNTLASFYMNENLKIREAQAVGTSEFLDAELKKTRQKLVEKEKILSAYRSKFMGGLPDELESNLRTLDRLQQQLTDRQSMLRETKNSIGSLKSQIAQIQKLKASVEQTMTQQVRAESGVNQPHPSDFTIRLAQAQRELEDLLLRYTDKHPDVLKQRATVLRLEQLLEAEGSLDSNISSASADPIDYRMNSSTRTIAQEADIQQQIRLNQLKNEMRQIQLDINDIQRRMKVYQRRVEETPKREQELRSLERDYTNIQAIYSSLLDRKLEAELSVNMEKKQKGEQFRILDFARLPQRPISPDVRKLFVFSFATGAVIGGGIIFILVFFDGSIRRDEEIEVLAGLPILASVAPLKISGNPMKKRVQWLFFFLLVGYIFLIMAGFAFVYFAGVDKILILF
ncbi:polysaccharide chain length determinant protein, PEP-CTERM locus subfamily [Desulfocicer vacuolatum DSM 3385]|uniref:Polysaccharide chain length determinant protein, PEP-CTERM locus subfamily n=1 Tax=Desulfocicer vacuolatum DSM 3385 TaxID=1121400 RepID=A0A1W1ZQD3_9BACT|nr:GNVR domain-containing protein [Desulfocicer vacuolatum]SMC50604.1 polysaccharide chain length determinant protein, PEP-CTERM locus subfamily [Desulfocicer vacuolatum DSM 3385]